MLSPNLIGMPEIGREGGREGGSAVAQRHCEKTHRRGSVFLVSGL